MIFEEICYCWPGPSDSCLHRIRSVKPQERAVPRQGHREPPLTENNPMGHSHSPNTLSLNSNRALGTVLTQFLGTVEAPTILRGRAADKDSERDYDS